MMPHVQARESAALCKRHEEIFFALAFGPLLSCLKFAARTTISSRSGVRDWGGMGLCRIVIVDKSAVLVLRTFSLAEDGATIACERPRFDRRHSEMVIRQAVL
jgi:hypothetical protein